MPYGPATGVANDEDGNFQFYTTGCKIINHKLEVMENGDDIDSGADNIENCADFGGAWYVKNGTFIFPCIKNENQYNLYYLRFIRTTDTSFIFDRLYESTIDMQQNGGAGTVLEKNKIVLDDSLHNQIAVTRHGNGRDWWIVVRRGVGREFWTVLVGPEGIVSKTTQDVLPPQPPFSIRFEWSDYPGTYWVPNEYAWETEGTSAFSPDGTKYCESILGLGFEIYDFDRCSGELTFRRLIPMPRYIKYPLSEIQVADSSFKCNRI
jgi:hypothetical protein